MTCCDVNGLNAIFRGRFVTRDKQTFLRSGLDKRQRGFLAPLDLQGSTILDIGCGVGALGLSALRQGARHAQLVDVSRAYLKAAGELAASLTLENDVTILQGDVTELTPEAADIVFLDRVVCCYPEATRLLTKAALLSNRDLVLSYPASNWWLKLGRRFLNLSMMLTRNPYRFYLHDEATLLDAAVSAGHTVSHKRRLGLWKLCRLTKA